MGSRFAAAAAATLILAFCAIAGAQMKPEAQARLDSGLAHFTAKQWDEAIADFKAGYEIDPQPDFLYAWAQVERLRGNCRAAVPLYQRYLASGVTAEQAKITADHMASCKAALVEEPARPRRKQPWTRDVFGHALVGSGAAALAVGTVFYFSSSSSADSAPDAMTYAEYADRIETARTRRALAWAGIGAGAALISAGVLHYAFRDAPEVTAWLGPGGGAVVLAGEF